METHSYTHSERNNYRSDCFFSPVHAVKAKKNVVSNVLKWKYSFFFFLKNTILKCIHQHLKFQRCEYETIDVNMKQLAPAGLKKEGSILINIK